MTTNNGEDTLPPFGSPSETAPPSASASPPPGTVPSGGSPADPSPPIEFLPYVDEVEEKRKFWQVVFITMAIFFVLSVLIVGFIISQRLSTPADSKISVKYIDTALPTSGVLPTRQPTRAPTSLGAIGSAEPTPLSLTRIPTSRPKPTAQITYIVQTTGTTTPGATIPITSATATPTPNGSVTPTVSLLPTMTPTVTPTITNTPTITPTPTAYLVTSVDTYNYTTVYAGSTATATFQIYNTGGTSLYISNLALVPANTSSAFSIVAGGPCISETSTPVIITGGSLKCVNVMVAPTYSTVNTTTLQILWNGTYIKNIALSVTVPTPTPTPTTAP